MINEEVEMLSVDELLEQTFLFNFVSDDVSQIALLTRQIKKLKNEVIGSNRQKENVFNHNFVPSLLSILNNDALDVSLRTEVAIILGSLAKGRPSHLQKLIDCNVIPHLLDGLKTPHKSFTDACIRALRTIYTSKSAPIDFLYADFSTLKRLLSVVHSSVCAQECVGTILMNTCKGKRCQNALQAEGVIPCFAPLLFSSVSQIKIIALGVFSAICHNNREVSEIVAYTTHMGCSLLEQVRRVLTRDNDLDVHLAAARCVTILCRAGAMSTDDYLIVKKVMPLLVRTCKFDHNPYVKARQRILCCETLAHLIEENLTLQKLTSWNNMCLQVMGHCLNCDSVERSVTDEAEKWKLIDDLHQGALLVLGALASNDEEIRRKIVQEIPNLPEHITKGLQSNNPAMQLASTKCLHSFSRSVEQIRTVCMEKPVAKPLLQMMQSPDAEIAMSAASVVANLVLEFSPCKSMLVEFDCVPVICTLAKSEDISCRLNGIWGLMNLAYRADDKVKSSILSHFTPADMLRALTESSPDSPVVCRLLGLIKNLLSNKEHTDSVMSAHGTSIIQAVIFVLENAYCPEDKEQALCILANVSYGNLAKDYIMSNEDVLRKIINYLMYANPRFQMAAAFTICNLIWKDDAGYAERQAKLREMGVHKLLSQIVNTTKDTILYDKVKMAAQNLS